MQQVVAQCTPIKHTKSIMKIYAQRTHEILERKKLFAPEVTASGIVPVERGAIGFSSSIAFQNALNHENQTIASEVTLFLAIAAICIRFVTSVFFSTVIDLDPLTQIRGYYGMISTSDNYGRLLKLRAFSHEF